MIKYFIMALYLAIAAGTLFGETGDFIASVGAQSAATFGLPSGSGQSYSLVAPLEMAIAQGQTLFKPVFNATMGGVYFKDGGGANVAGQGQGALDYLIVNVNQTWKAFYYNSQRQLVSKTLNDFDESQFQDQVALSSGQFQLASLAQITITSSSAAWGKYSGTPDTTSGIGSAGADWAQSQGNWYLLNSSTGIGLKIQPKNLWQFEEHALAWWNSANPSAPATLAQVRTTLLSENLKDIPGDSSQNATNFSVVAYGQAFPDFRTDIYQGLLSLDASTNYPQTNFLTVFKNYVPMALQADVTSPDKGWGFLDSSIYITPSVGTFGYAYLFQQFLNSQHYTQNIDPLKYDLDSRVSAQLAQKALHYLIGVEDYLHASNPLPASSLNSNESAYLNVIQSQFATLPEVDEMQDPLSGITLTDSIGTGSASYIGTNAILSFVTSPDPDLGASDPVFIPNSANLISQQNVSNFSAIAGLGNSFAPIPQSNAITILFSTPITLGSIVLWCSRGTSISTLQYLDSLGQFHTMDVSSLMTQRVTAQNTDGSESLVLGSLQTVGSFPLLIYNLPIPLNVSSCTINLPGGKVYGLRAYQGAQQSFPYTWTLGNGTATVCASSLLPFQELECFPSARLSLSPYFVQTGFGQRPALAYRINELPHFNSPIRYTLDGIESPLSYTLKLWNNAQWQGSPRSGFAYSELDLCPT